MSETVKKSVETGFASSSKRAINAPRIEKVVPRCKMASSVILQKGPEKRKLAQADPFLAKLLGGLQLQM